MPPHIAHTTNITQEIGFSTEDRLSLAGTNIDKTARNGQSTTFHLSGFIINMLITEELSSCRLKFTGTSPKAVSIDFFFKTSVGHFLVEHRMKQVSGSFPLCNDKGDSLFGLCILI